LSTQHVAQEKKNKKSPTQPIYQKIMCGWVGVPTSLTMSLIRWVESKINS